MIINKDTIRRYLKKEISDNDFAREFFPYINRIAQHTAAKMNFDGDDLAQELWELFVSKIIHVYDFNLSLDAYVYGYARRHCLYIRGKPKEINFSEFERNDNGDEDNEGGFWLQNENEPVEMIDEEAIEAKIKGIQLSAKTMSDPEYLAKLPAIAEELARPCGTKEDLAKACIRAGLAEKMPIQDIVDALDNLEKMRKKTGRDRDLMKESINIPADHRELRTIRLKMGKTKPQFAKDLGIQLSSLDAYEYGRTRTVPVRVMEDARILASNFTDQLGDARKQFDGLKMSEIVSNWASQANIPVSDTEKLAVLLGTTRTTIRRWLSNESRADITKIVALDSVVSVGKADALMSA